MGLKILPLQQEHFEGVVELQSVCFPPPFSSDLLWQPDHLAAHLNVFPEGQFVAVEFGAVIASASSLIIGEDSWRSHQPWQEVTGGHKMAAHDPTGTTLYGMDISVHPDFRGLGIARRLYQARFGLVRDLGLVRFGTACRIPDFLEWSTRAQNKSVEDYVGEVMAERVADRTLTPLLRSGVRVVEIVRDHMEDEESGNAAVALEWNP